MTRDDIPETQGATQSQQSQLWNIESQQIENIVWGRLYAKNIRLKSLDLCKPLLKAGRAETNDLCIDSPDLPAKIRCRISSFHFQISRDLSDLSNPVYIQDFSRNGTFVNGQKIGLNNRQILQNNDVISLSHPQYKAYVFKDYGPNETQGLPTEICSQYYISKKLGNGACGVVRLVYDLRTCKEYAMKTVKKNLLADCTKVTILNEPERVMNEAKIMKALEHPCVIKMHDIVDKPDSVCMVLELMRGGDLLSRIVENKRLSEQTSKLYFYQMCHAVKYLHDKGITHRDLKPDNVLLETKDEETLLKVSDFGLSKFVQKDSVMRTLCGTPLYVAPEVISTGGRGCYTKKVDVWSLGVVLFVCLSGTLPFSDEYGTPAGEQIKKGIFSFRHPSWKEVSTAAIMLIKKMLTVDPNERPSINYVLRHRWLRDQDVVKKANNLMKISITSDSDDENFLEPPAKRLRR